MGAEFKDEPKASKTVESEETPTTFGDPESYKHLPVEKRKEMTERMKTNFMGILSKGQWIKGK
jgi:hypothetical protein